MSLVFRFRVTFEDESDVERIIDVAATNTFKEFHHKIQEAIGFDNIKTASFYKTNDTWRPGEEFCTEPKPSARSAGASALGKFIDDPHQKFLYVYDAEGGDWHLRTEVMRLFKGEVGADYPTLVKSNGEAPKQYIINKLSETNPAEKLFKEADDLIGDLLDDDDDLDDDEDDEEEDEKSEFDLFGDQVDESEIDDSQINDGTPNDV